LKHRSNVFILMQILELLMEQPRGPTRLAQAANLNYQKCVEYLEILSANQFVGKDIQEGHEVYSATLKGKEIFLRWDGIFDELNLP
jgi:predicted transcriptional regulator